MDDKKKACAEPLAALARCAQDTDCFKSGKTFEECFKARQLFGCEPYVKGYFHCHHGQLDMRNRIRGQKFRDTTATPQ